MFKLIGVGRLGQDAELRRDNKGNAVASFSVAWNYGKPDENEKRPSQWIDVALFGNRAEKLHPFLKKGTSLFLDLRDVHIEVFRRSNGSDGFKLVGTVDSIEFAGNRPGNEAKPEPKTRSNEDIPF